MKYKINDIVQLSYFEQVREPRNFDYRITKVVSEGKNKGYWAMRIFPKTKWLEFIAEEEIK